MFDRILIFAVACFPLSLASFAVPSPARSGHIFFTSAAAPEVTLFANLLVRSGWMKNCGYENGNPRALYLLFWRWDLDFADRLTRTPPRLSAGLRLHSRRRRQRERLLRNCCDGGEVRVADGLHRLYLECGWECGCVSNASMVGRGSMDVMDVMDALLILASSDATKPFCTTAYFVDNYAMFTCGNGQAASMVSAFYHSTSANVRASIKKGQPAASSVGPSSSEHSQKNSAQDSSPPLGPIVGGVVGGVGVVIIGFVLIWRTKRKAKKTSPTDPSSGSVVELTKPPTAHSQATELASDDKAGSKSFYSELEVPRTVSEIPLGRAHYAHEAASVPADASTGRSELIGSEQRVYAELDGHR